MLHPVELKIQLPRVTRHVVRTMIVAKDRETVLVASPMRRGRNLLFLMTPSVVGLDDKPAVEPLLEDQRLMRFYDVSSFLHAVQDFAGPAMGIGSPSRGGGTPLTGATFTLDEPHARMDSGELVDLIKAKAFPETWGVKGNTIEMGQGRKLLVRQKPEVLKEIDRLLEERFASYARTIAVEAAVVTFRKGALAEWEREIPALGPGGYFAEDEKVRKLMEEAFKGLRVRLLETAEVTAFPLQRVFVGRILTERYVSDYEPQLSSCVSIFDPFVQTLCSGLLLDVRPSFARGADEILLDLRAALTRREFTGDVPTSSGLGAVQALRCTGFRWRANVTCVKGKWTVAGLESRGQGDEAEDVALFLRARPNLLK